MVGHFGSRDRIRAGHGGGSVDARHEMEVHDCGCVLHMGWVMSEPDRRERPGL